MHVRRNLRRRIDDTLAVASPLALAEAMGAHVSSRSPGEVRALIARSLKRMDEAQRAQLALYVDLEDPDDLIGHRFSAFLRQNPRAIAALDADAAEAILRELGEVPPVERAYRRLPPRTAALVAAVVAIAVLPLAAQYAHQRGLLQGLSEPAIPAPIVPFVQRIGAPIAAAAVKPRAHRSAHRHPARRRPAPPRPHPVRARRPAVARAPHYAIRRKRALAWKFAPRNNPYLNPARWKHPYTGDSSRFGERARMSVRAYLHAIVAGNLRAALAHLGLPPTGDTHAIAELPIITRSTSVAIVGSKVRPDGNEQVQARIVTGSREYFEEFSVAHDGPALRIVDHYYIPVNRSAQLAERASRAE